MRNNGIVYANLRREMLRRGLTAAQLAKRLGRPRGELRRKLAGQEELTLDEAFAIQRAAFPDRTVAWLFGRGDGPWRG